MWHVALEPTGGVDVDVAEVIHGAGGFVRTLGARVVRTDRDGTVLRLDAGPELHNHVGGPHAAAIFGLGETAAFALLLEVFGDLVEAGAVPLVKSAEISYSAVVTGPMLATARLVDDEVSARASLGERGVATFDVEVVFSREADDGQPGEQTAVMRPRMALKRFT
jgi:acyl-coenzyme A thioesterase PaaI-like protein